MFLQKRKILRLFLLLLLAIGVFVWNVFLWKGTVYVVSNATPFTVTFKTPKHIQGIYFECASSPCLIRVTPRSYNMKIESYGYVSENKEVDISWQNQNNFPFSLEKIPVLVQLNNRPLEWKEEAPLQRNGKTYSIDEEGKVSEFIEKENINTLIAEMPESNYTLLLDPQRDILFAFSETELFEIDIQQKRKFQVFYTEEGETIQEIRAFRGDLLLIQSELSSGKRSFFFVPSLRKVLSFVENPQPPLVCQDPLNFTRFLYLIKSPTGSEWLLKDVSTNTQEISGIAGFNFTSSPQSIFCATNGNVFLKTGDGEIFEFQI